MKKTILWSLVSGMFAVVPASVFATGVSDACKAGIKAHVEKQKGKSSFDADLCATKKKKKVKACKSASIEDYVEELKKQCNGDKPADEEKPAGDKPADEEKPAGDKSAEDKSAEESSSDKKKVKTKKTKTSSED